MLSLPVGRIVVGTAAVRNDAATELSIALYQPTVIIDDVAVEPLLSDGDSVVEPGDTEPAWFVTPIDDLDIDLHYRLGFDLTRPPLTFAADPSAPSGGTPSTTDPGPAVTDAEAQLSASIRLVSLLADDQFGAAVQLAAPGSDAEAYLADLDVMVAESFFFASLGPDSSTELCLQDGATDACNDITVDGLDPDGLITSLTIAGIPAGELLAGNRAGGDDQFQLVVDSAMHWPGGVTVVSWTLTNSTDAEVALLSAKAVDANLAQIESERGVFEELPGGRTVSDVSLFAGNVLDRAFEVSGDGRDVVSRFSAVAFIGEPFDGLESTSEFDDSTTDFQTGGGRTFTIPGTWSTTTILNDDGTALLGVGQTLGAPTVLRRGGVVLLAFSPPFSPLDSTPDELGAALSEFVVLDSVEYSPAIAADGRTTAVLNGELQWFGDPSLFFAIPGNDEFFVVVASLTSNEGFDGLADILIALTDITQVTED